MSSANAFSLGACRFLAFGEELMILSSTVASLKHCETVSLMLMTFETSA